MTCHGLICFRISKTYFRMPVLCTEFDILKKNGIFTEKFVMITSWVQTSQDHPSFLLLLLFCLQFSNLWSYEFASWYCWLIMETVCWIWTISLSWDPNKILLSIWSGSSRRCLLGQLISTTEQSKSKSSARPTTPKTNCSLVDQRDWSLWCYSSD